MKTFFAHLWLDENFFLRAAALGVFGLGQLFGTGVLPTYIDGGGQKVAMLMTGAAFAIATGKFQIPGMGSGKSQQPT